MQHRGESALAWVRDDVDPRNPADRLLDEGQPFRVIDVQHPSERPANSAVLFGERGLTGKSRVATDARPPPGSLPVDVFDLDPRLMEERGEFDVTQALELSYQFPPRH